MTSDALGGNYDLDAVDPAMRAEMDRRARAVLGKPLAQCTKDDLQRLANDTTYITADVMASLAEMQVKRDLGGQP